MNTKLLLEVKEAILAEPKRADMDFWSSTKVAPTLKHTKVQNRFPSCGFIGCIAGWGIALKKLHSQADETKNISLLNLNVGEMMDTTEPSHDQIEIDAMYAFDISSAQANSLFFPIVGWPARFTDELYIHKDGTPEYAKVIANVIDFFISTKETFNDEETYTARDARRSREAWATDGEDNAG